MYHFNFISWGDIRWKIDFLFISTPYVFMVMGGCASNNSVIPSRDIVGQTDKIRQMRATQKNAYFQYMKSLSQEQMILYQHTMLLYNALYAGDILAIKSLMDIQIFYDATVMYDERVGIFGNDILTATMSFHNDDDISIELVERSKAHVNDLYPSGRSVLVYAMHQNQSFKVIAKLIDIGANIYHMDKNGMFPLKHAMDLKRYDLVVLITNRIKEDEARRQSLEKPKIIQPHMEPA